MISSIIILCSMLMSMVSMFIYFQRRINSGLKSNELSESITLEIEQIKSQLTRVKDQAHAVEKFSNDIDRDTRLRLDHLQSTNQKFSDDYGHWNNLYKESKEILEELNSKQNLYSNLTNIMHDAEQHILDLYHKIQDCKSVEASVDFLCNQTQQTIDDISQKNEKLSSDAEKFMTDYSERVQEINMINVDSITRELELFKQSELTNIKQNFQNMYGNFDDQVRILSNNMQKDVVHTKDYLETIYGEFENKNNSLIVRLKEDGGKIKQDLSVVFSSYKKQITDIATALSTDLNTVQSSISDCFEECKTKLINQGEDSYLKLEGKIGRKQSSIDEKINVLEGSVSQKLIDVETISNTQYEKIDQKMTVLASAVEAAKQQLFGNISQLDSYVKERNDEIKTNYQVIEQNRIEQEKKITEISNESLALESRVRDQLDAKHQSYLGDIMTHIADAKQNISEHTATREQDFQEMLKLKQNDIQMYIEELKQSFIQSLKQDAGDFGQDFEKIKSEMLEKITNSQNQLDFEINNKEFLFEKQFETLNSAFELQHTEFNKKFDGIKNAIDEQVLAYQMKLDTSINNKENDISQRFETLVSAIDSKTESFDTKFKDYTEEISNKLSEYQERLEADIREKEDSLSLQINKMLTLLSTISGDFDNNFEKEKQEIWEKIKEHQSKIEVTISEKQQLVDTTLEDFFHSLDSQCDKYERELTIKGKKIFDKYIENMTERNSGFDKEIREIMVSIGKLQTENTEAQKIIEEKYIDLRRDSEIKETEHEKFVNSLEQKNKKLKEEMIRTQERYNEITNKHQEVTSMYGNLSDTRKELDIEFAKTENFSTGINTLYLKFNNIREDIEHANENLKPFRQEFRDALTTHKNTLKELDILKNKFEKNSRQFLLVESQEGSITKIKTLLDEVHNKQKLVSEYQKELNGWDKDYKLYTNNLDSLQSKTKGIEEVMRTWNSRIDSTNNAVQLLNNKYTSIEKIQNDINDISSQVPSIMDNISEYREIQQSASERDLELHSTISEVDKRIAILGDTLKQEHLKEIKSFPKKGKHNASSRDLQKLVLELYQVYKWTEESIGQFFGISIGEVRLILQKSTIS